MPLTKRIEKSYKLFDMPYFFDILKTVKKTVWFLIHTKWAFA